MVSIINSPVTGHNIDLLNSTRNNSGLKNNFIAANVKGANILRPLNIKHEKAVVSLAQWLSQSDLVTKLDYSLSPTPSNSIQHSVILNFRLSEKFVEHFILLRGLFDFHSISGLAVYADRPSSTFRVEIKIDDAKQIVNYFEIIFNSLLKELNFKAILKGIIKLEQRIKQEQNLAYESLWASI